MPVIVFFITRATHECSRRGIHHSLLDPLYAGERQPATITLKPGVAYYQINSHKVRCGSELGDSELMSIIKLAVGSDIRTCDLVRVCGGGLANS